MWGVTFQKRTWFSPADNLRRAQEEGYGDAWAMERIEHDGTRVVPAHGAHDKLSRVAGLPVLSQRRCLPLSAGQNQRVVASPAELDRPLATGRR